MLLVQFKPLFQHYWPIVCHGSWENSNGLSINEASIWDKKSTFGTDFGTLICTDKLKTLRAVYCKNHSNDSQANQNT